MKKNIISTEKAPAAIGIYSQGVAVNGGTTVYLSGQIPLIPETMEIVEGGVEEQIHQVFKNLSALCAACLLYTSPSPRDLSTSRMPSSA